MVVLASEAKLVVPLTDTPGDIDSQLVFTKAGRLDSAAGWNLSGAERSEEVQEAAEGADDHFRRRREQQPLYGDRGQERDSRNRTLVYAIGVFGNGAGSNYSDQRC